MDALGSRAGVKVVYVPVTFDNILEAVRNHYVDAAIASISVTEERRKMVSFSKPYLDTGGLALLVGERSTVKDPRDLTGAAVGVFKGSTAEQFAATLAGVKVQPYYSKYDMVTAFNMGTLKALIDDRPVLESQLAAGKIRGGRIAALLNREEYAIAFSGGNRELEDKLNKALESMKKSGEIDALYRKWFTGNREPG
jgi:polar amino acid transport system substrate-binding protein